MNSPVSNQKSMVGAVTVAERTDEWRSFTSSIERETLSRRRASYQRGRVRASTNDTQPKAPDGGVFDYPIAFAVNPKVEVRDDSLRGFPAAALRSAD